MDSHKKHSSKFDMEENEINSQEDTSHVDVEINGERGETDTTATDAAEEINKYKEEAEASKDKYLRLFAEFDNFKRRTAKERIDTIQTAGKEVITSLLDVLDDMDRAEKQMATTENIDQIKEGVQLVFNKLRNTLTAKGLKPMVSIDTDFDVEKHEAITEIPVTDKNQKDKVVDEIVKGYYLNDKLIRFAKVVVGK